MDLIEVSDFLCQRPLRKGCKASSLNRLKALKAKHPQIGDVDGLGLAMRIEICQKDGRTPDRVLTDKIMNIGLKGKLSVAGRQRGLLLSIGGYFKNVFTLAPSLYITHEEIDLAIDLFEEAFKEGLKA